MAPASARRFHSAIGGRKPAGQFGQMLAETERRQIVVLLQPGQQVEPRIRERGLQKLDPGQRLEGPWPPRAEARF